MPSTSTKAAPSAKERTAKAKVKPEPRPVMLNGKPAKTRHFLLDRSLHRQASKQTLKDGLVISDVLRYGLSQYAASSPMSGKSEAPLTVLPKEAQSDLKALWLSGDSERITHYLAALSRGGWTNQAIADSLIASGAVDKMTRQAVNLRVVKAPEELRDDLPEVPERGPRRSLVSPRKGVKGKFEGAKKKTRSNSHDLSFRVTDEEYEVASKRAKYEGAMMSGVLDNILLDYVNGEYDVKDIKEFAG